MKKTKHFNASTLLAEIKVLVRLYENDYVDVSSSLEFSGIFGGEIGPDRHDLMMDEAESRIQLQQEVDIVREEHLEVLDSRSCQLQAILNLHVNNAAEKYEEDYESNKIVLPRVISDWAKQFADEYSNENAYFLSGVGTE